MGYCTPNRESPENLFTFTALLRLLHAAQKLTTKTATDLIASEEIYLSEVLSPTEETGEHCTQRTKPESTASAMTPREGNSRLI